MNDVPPCPTASPPARSRKADSRILFELIAAQEREDTGRVDIEEADLISDWAKPSHDLSASSIAVFDGERLVAYAELMGADRADAAVLPAYRGRGIGTWLAAWLRSLGTRAALSVVGMPVPEGSAGDRLLAALGYRIRWTSWILALPEGTRDRAARAAAGLRRSARPSRRTSCPRTTCSRTPSSSGPSASASPTRTSRPATFGRPGYAPWNFRVAARSGRCGRRRRRSSSSRPRARRPTSRASPYARTSATAASPRRCSSTRSTWPASTARRSPS